MTAGELHIRPMTSDDIDAVNAIERLVFSDPWPRSAFTEMLGVTSRINLVGAMPDGTLAGYVLAQAVVDEVQIHNIAVRPDNQRRGIGGRLLAEAETTGKKRGALCSVLDVRVENVAAMALYERFGYRMIGRRKNYYRRPLGDALILFKRFDGSSESVNAGQNDGMVS